MSIKSGDAGLRVEAVLDDGSHNHTLALYDTDLALVPVVVEHLVAALEAGGAGLVVATTSHRLLIERGLRARGIDPATDQLLALDVGAVPSSVTGGGEQPVPARGCWLVAGLVEHRLAAGGPVACYTPISWPCCGSRSSCRRCWPSRGRLDELAAAEGNLALLCGYPAAAFRADRDLAVVGAIREVHGRIVRPAAGEAGASYPSERAGQDPNGRAHAAESSRLLGEGHGQQELLERIRAANQGLAYELSAARSRTQKLRHENRKLKGELRQLRHRLEAVEAREDAGAG